MSDWDQRLLASHGSFSGVAFVDVALVDVQSQNRKQFKP